MNPGDLVQITTSEETLEGVIIQRPELLGEDILVLKLENGYNIGIEKKKIQKVKVLKPYEKPKEKKLKLRHTKGLPTVSILSTGGTIASKVDYRTGGVYADYTAEDYVQMLPELAGIANIKARKVMAMMSEDIASKEWIEIAKEVKKELDAGADGVVITHGTDTLHYSTAALSFFLQGLPKPVIFTAAQRSIDRGSSDAFMNLICSVKAATSWDGAEVATCLHGTTNDSHCILNRGTKTRKMHTSRRDAFRPINELPLAEVPLEGSIRIVNASYKKRNDGKAALEASFDPKTALIQIHPEIDPSIIDYYVSKGYKGIVLSATALGHIPVNGPKSFIPQLEKAIKKGVIVAIASQTLYGRAHPLVYTNLRKLSLGLGCVFAEDMTPETAFVKLGWLLSREKDTGKVKELFKTNLTGEISERILPDSFLY